MRSRVLLLLWHRGYTGGEQVILVPFGAGAARTHPRDKHGTPLTPSQCMPSCVFDTSPVGSASRRSGGEKCVLLKTGPQI